MDIADTKCSGCGLPLRIERLRCRRCNVQLEGDFEVSSLGRLSMENQVFVAAFLRSHGSIKQMERLFGISYPTVKNRLAAIVEEIDRSFEAPSPNSMVLEKLSRGEISFDEAMRRLG